jgi:hypothetical protein
VLAILVRMFYHSNKGWLEKALGALAGEKNQKARRI